jgi:molybdenum cofactor synthesis domain-containing protein
MAKTAAALVIGNEILTGKVAEANVLVLARELFGLGIELRRIVVCPDEVDTIAADLRALSDSHDVVVTSGGVGPTHDDVTIKAVAQAFGVRIVRAEAYTTLLRDYYGERLTDMHLRMADVPEGARLAMTQDNRWPTVVMRNVYVFPGVPQIFAGKVSVLRAELASGKRFHSRAVYVRLDEPTLAPLLDRLAAGHPDVNIGSYLTWDKAADYDTKLTVDGRSADAVEACMGELLCGIAPTLVVRIE